MMSDNIWQDDLVRLRAVEPADWQHFFEWNQDSYFERTLDETHPFKSQAAVQKWAADQAVAEPKGDDYRWVIESLAGEFAGTINTHHCDRRNGTFEYGVAIRREHWRKGYATEAIRLVLRYFFDDLGYQKVNVHIYDFNAGSVELHRRLGFREEGRLRRMGYAEGSYFDWIVMGMTREEYDQGSGGPGRAG